MRAPIGDFAEATPLPEVEEPLCPAVAAAVATWTGRVPVDRLLWVDSDPERADTAVFVETYGADLATASANCVVIAGKRAGETSLAAAVVLATSRIDVNGVVRKQLGVRKASFAPRETAVEATGMEYGGITPIGLPADWPLLLDPAVLELPHVLIGSGSRRGKLIVPGEALSQLPGAVVVPGLGG
ncbi:YbaK/EbsC family protein [Streptomyces profundus]|uniref:YbaK/EbsC family protein n=1 Tax=Streptomyces profundus TaxID=2867410 RepID=UPI001D162911|nr:YbaK/EbsC family protein [Streptomyces sp. MA3_2.13]UED82850.1 YbaK/EbsC family protein [Streptomyces sp. MA3_2.13]